MNTHVLRAVFKRNFVSYFANPTGYVFICVFVILSAIAAYWPHEFFNANLANLNQLNGNPYLNFFTIMLVFIPAITMGIWADERRQGTDELLLTIPAGDFEVVLGKYLAAVAIFTASLAFSLICNFAVIKLLLGDPDAGLFLGTYAGYWLVGLAMLAIGMVASFLSANITIAFVLGVVFNCPLVLAAAGDLLFGRQWAMAIKQWSLAGQFRDFSQGVLSLAGAAYFVMIAAAMLYLCMVLIGRRHWRTGWQQRGMTVNYATRVVALLVVAFGVTLLLERFGRAVRLDVTTEQLSSLSPQTKKLLAELKFDRPVQIEAFVSPNVPESYVQTRLNLLAMLRELEARGGDKVRVRINETERFTEEATRADRRYKITARPVESSERGARNRDYIFMGVAMTSGAQKPVVIPFIDRGIPVEYELVRSLCTVARQKRKRIGILNTDAQLYGRFNMQTMQSSQKWPIVDELEKQYEVVQVDPTKPIEKFDALLAVQPSSMGPEEMDNFLAAVKHGQPTAIFEDPCPVPNLSGPITPTGMPRQMGGGMMPFMQRQSLPKGDIRKLWELLGVDFAADQIIWQKYNPYPKITQFPEEFVFVDKGEGNKEPFSKDDPISANLQQVLFPFPGSIAKLNASDLAFTPLARTGPRTGTVRISQLDMDTPREEKFENREYVLAAHIRGKPKTDPQMAGEPTARKEPSAKKDAAKPAGPADMNVVLVADLDLLSAAFFQLRETGDIPEAGIHFDFDNVTFILNALDDLAGDPRFMEIRSRRPKHRTLTRIEERTDAAKTDAAKQREQYYNECKKTEEAEQKALDDKIKEMQGRASATTQDVVNEVAIALRDGSRRVAAAKEKAQQERDRAVAEIQKNLNGQVGRVQNQSKLLAVLLPPIAPLLVGVAVFITRRLREREGVPSKRLRR